VRERDRERERERERKKERVNGLNYKSEESQKVYLLKKNKI